MIETGEWDSMNIPVRPLLSERYPGDVFLLLAAGMQAVAQDDLFAADNIEARLDELQAQDTAGLKSYLQGQVTLEDLKTSSAVAYRELGALIHLARGDNDEAVLLMEAAIEKEKEMHPAYGPPEPMVPPVELYGDVLMATGRLADAAKQYDQMIARMPNRTQSLLGAARAADALGDHEKARRRYAELAAIWVDSEQTPGLREVKTHTSESSP